MGEHECAAVDLLLAANPENCRVGDIVEVKLLANSEGAAMSGVRAVILYDESVLQFVGHDRSLGKGHSWHLVHRPPWGGMEPNYLVANMGHFAAPGILVDDVADPVLFKFRFVVLGIPLERNTTLQIVPGPTSRLTTKRIDWHGFKPPMPGSLGLVHLQFEGNESSEERDALRAALVFLDADDSREALLIERINELLAEAE